MRVSGINEAWKIAERIFPTGYKLDEEASKRAGYAIYSTTSKDVQYAGFHISDLETRLELNIGAESLDIWIDETDPKALMQKIREEETVALRALRIAEKIDKGSNVTFAMKHRYEAIRDLAKMLETKERRREWEKTT